MIEIDEPPDIAACAPCMQPLIWLWSPRRKAWVSVTPGPEPDLLKVHGCRKLQDFPTWKDLPHGDPPSQEYREAREAIKNKERTEIEEEQ